MRKFFSYPRNWKYMSFALMGILAVGLAAPQAFAAPIDSVLSMVQDIQAKVNSSIFGLQAIKTALDGKASQTSVNDIQTKVNTVSSSQYVPFKVALSGLPATCASAGQGNEFDKISINGDADFMVTSILFNPSGMDESSDNFRVNKVAIDGKDFGLSIFYFKQPTAFDIMGALVLPTQNSGIQQQFPTTIVAEGTGSDDIVIDIECFANITTDITFDSGSIIVSGWKQADDTIGAAYSE